MNFIHYKIIKSYSLCYMKIGNNMATIFKIVYVMILFLSLFLVAMNVDGKSFFILFKFPFTLLDTHNLMYNFINRILFSFIITAYVECETDADCPEIMCKWPHIVQCYQNVCICVHHTNPYI